MSHIIAPEQTETSAEDPKPKINLATADLADIDLSKIPERERWLYENPEAFAAVKRGLADIAAGRVHTRQSYAQYADAEIEE